MDAREKSEGIVSPSGLEFTVWTKEISFSISVLNGVEIRVNAFFATIISGVDFFRAVVSILADFIALHVTPCTHQP